MTKETTVIPTELYITCHPALLVILSEAEGSPTDPSTALRVTLMFEIEDWSCEP